MFKKIAVFLIFAAFPAISCLAQTPDASAPPALTPEVVRRVQTEVRSRYNVPSQVDIAIAEPHPSEVKAFDEVTITFTGQGHSTDHPFLISRDRQTLARLEKFDISTDFMSKIDVKGRPVRGNAVAKVTIINFDDYQCPFCSRMHSTLFPNILRRYGKQVKFIYKDYPLVEIHPWAMHAAIAANCLAEQSTDAYWDFTDSIHEKQKVVSADPAGPASAIDHLAGDLGGKRNVDSGKLNACLAKSDESAVRSSMAEADKMGIDSTPTMFINGEKVSGAVPEQGLSAIIDRALIAAGETPPPEEKAPPAPPGAKR